MALLLSASAFGANCPSPSSPTFPPSVFVARPAPSPTPSVSPVAPPNGHTMPFTSRAWADTTEHSPPTSRPSTPGNVIDSDLESPHGPRRLELPICNDSMKYTRHRLPSHPLDTLGSFKTPDSPASPQVVVYQSRDRDMSQDSPTVPAVFQQRPLIPPQKAAAIPAQRSTEAKLSLFPAPPKPRTGTVPNFSEPRPFLKQSRSHTESSLPTLTKHNDNEQRPTGFQPRALRRAQTEGASSTTSPSTFHHLVPMPPPIPTINIERSALTSRRPSALEIVAARPLSAHMTTLYAGAGHAHEVRLVSGPQVEGQVAVKFVKKEEKARRRLEREREFGLRSRSAEPRGTTNSQPLPVLRPTVYQEVPVKLESPQLPVRKPTVYQEVPVKLESPLHALSSRVHRDTTIKREEPQRAPEFDLPARREALLSHHRSKPPSLDDPASMLPSPKASSLSLPTIHRPHPLRASAFRHTKRSQSEIRVPSSASRSQARSKHTRNFSADSQTPPTLPEKESPRSRTRSRASSVAPKSNAFDFADQTRIPPAQGPLDIRRSTFTPFKAGDMYELAARRERERDGTKSRGVVVPRSRFQYLEVNKPLPPPKPEASYAGGQGGREVVGRERSPLAKLARLVK